jgi:hypothetical protein
MKNPELELKAKNIWKASVRTILAIKLPSLDLFHFEDRGMSSDYVASEEVVYCFHTLEGGALRPVLTVRLQEQGVGAFCSGWCAN